MLLLMIIARIPHSKMSTSHFLLTISSLISNFVVELKPEPNAKSCPKESIRNQASHIFFAPKRKTDEDVDKDEDDEDEGSNSEMDFSSTPDTQPSKHNRKALFDLSMEHVKHMNGIDWTILFDFDFHFIDTSTNQVNVEHGEIAVSDQEFRIATGLE